MSKLNLKETKAELEEKELLKARKAARKTARYAQLDHDSPNLSRSPSKSSSRHKPNLQNTQAFKHVFSHEDEPTGWVPPQESHKADDDSEFRARLFDEMESDSTHAWFNTYVPNRWQSDPNPPMDKNFVSGLDDEQYAEFIRRGMWERSHKSEHEEQRRKKAEAKEKRKRQQEIYERSKQMEAEEIQRRLRRKEEKDQQRFIDTWKSYESRWTTLQTSTLAPNSIAFDSVPWPVFPSAKSVEDLTNDSIAGFLLSDKHSIGRSRKQRLRDAFLLFHPDRFESRFSSAIRADQKDKVIEGVGMVIRALNSLSESG